MLSAAPRYPETKEWNRVEIDGDDGPGAAGQLLGIARAGIIAVLDI
jgi:hypothetical protein